MIRRSAIVMIVIGSVLVPAVGRAEEKPVYITGGAGYLETEKPERQPGLEVEPLPDLHYWTYAPDSLALDGPSAVTGPMAAGQMAPGISFGVEVPVGERFSFTPSVAVGRFDNQTGDPGAPAEFRKGATLSYEFSNDWKLGASFFHITDGRAEVESENAGMVTFSFTVPIGR